MRCEDAPASGLVTKDTDFYDRILLESEPPKVVSERKPSIEQAERGEFVDESIDHIFQEAFDELKAENG